MRIAYVLKRYPRYSETFIVHEIIAHEKAGLEIEIFSLHPPLDAHFQDIIARVCASVNYLPKDGIKAIDFWTACEQASELLPDVWGRLALAKGELHINVYQALVLARQIRLKNIQHLHAHFATSATTVARLAAYFSGITYSFTAHAKDIFHESVQPDDLRGKLASAAFAVTISDFNLSYLKGRYGQAARQLTRIYNGLDFSYFTYKPPRKKGNRIVSVGRLVEKKGFLDLIDACALLTRERQDFECFIIGAGEMELKLRQRIQSSGLGQKIKLLGPQPQDEVRRFVQEANIFAAPCIIGADGNQDGLPTAILEAMALGVPCISTDVSGIPEAVCDNKTGLIVPQQNPAQLALAIRRLLSDYNLKLRLSREARKLVEAEFDVSRNTVRLRKLFYAALKKNRRAEQQKK